MIVRKMHKRWGSCARSGNVLLNSELVKTPLSCIEYVVMHELCHLMEQNHSPAFFRLLSRHLPDWRRRKERLERYVV
jgi:predicted metal-dependent hydrolase